MRFQLLMPSNNKYFSVKILFIMPHSPLEPDQFSLIIPTQYRSPRMLWSYLNLVSPRNNP